MFLLGGISSCQTFRNLTLLAYNLHVEKYLQLTNMWQSHHIDRPGLGFYNLHVEKYPQLTNMWQSHHIDRPGLGHWQAVRTERKAELRVHLHSRIIVNGAIPFSFAFAKTSLYIFIFYFNIWTAYAVLSMQELCRAGPDIRSLVYRVNQP